MGQQLRNYGDRLGAWRAVGCITVAALWLGWGCGGRAVDGEISQAAAPSSPFSGDCRENPLFPGCAPRMQGVGPPPPIETCEDNPLLVGCLPQPEPAPTPQPASMAPELEPQTGLLSTQAVSILAANCGACHDSQAMGPTAVVDITNLNHLIQRGSIVPCSADESPIINYMRSGRMPPVQSGLPPVSAADIDVVAQAIELGCSEPQKRCAVAPAAPGCAALLAEAVLERDCGACHGQAAREALEGAVLADGMTYIDDMARLILEGQVSPCRSNESQILIRGQDGSMPPARSRGGFALRGRDLSVVSDFIDGLCPGPATSGPEDAEQRRVEELLGTQCGECHGRAAVELGNVSGGIAEIESVDSLFRSGWLLPCAAESSVLIGRLRDGSMPPADATGPRPSDADIGVIVDFVERPCRAP